MLCHYATEARHEAVEGRKMSVSRIWTNMDRWALVERYVSEDHSLIAVDLGRTVTALHCERSRLLRAGQIDGVPIPREYYVDKRTDEIQGPEVLDREKILTMAAVGGARVVEVVDEEGHPLHIVGDRIMAFSNGALVRVWK